MIGQIDPNQALAQNVAQFGQATNPQAPAPQSNFIPSLAALQNPAAQAPAAQQPGQQPGQQPINAGGFLSMLFANKNMFGPEYGPFFKAIQDSPTGLIFNKLGVKFPDANAPAQANNGMPSAQGMAGMPTSGAGMAGGQSQQPTQQPTGQQPAGQQQSFSFMKPIF